MKKQLLIAVEFCGEVDDDGGANSSAGGFFNADRASYGESYWMEWTLFKCVSMVISRL